MKKTIVVLIALGLVMMAMPMTKGYALETVPIVFQTAQDKLNQTLLNIQYFLIGFAVLLAGVMIAVWGITFMTGAVDEMPPEKIAQRKKQLMYIFVGLIIVLLSTVLVEIAKMLIVR